MQNLLLSMALACACMLAGAQSLWGQNAAGRGATGYFDPIRHLVYVLPQASANAEEPATTTFGGTINFNFTITVSANIASTAKITCTAMASLLDLSAQNEIIEQDSVLATRSGSTATCSPSIPYSWKLASGTTDKVSLGYIITAPAEATGTAVLPARTSEQTAFTTISVPANGTTTTETITATF